jgi:hypothetical protein
MLCQESSVMPGCQVMSGYGRLVQVMKCKARLGEVRFFRPR